MREASKHPQGAMRRSDREIADRAEIDELLRAGRIMHLALSDDNVPFLVPLFYAYDGKAVYFHSAQAGTKIDILKRNNLVRFEVLSELGIIEADSACDFEAKHRTVIGLGRASFVEGEDEKAAILDMIVGRFTDRRFEYPKENLKRTCVIRIDIESIKGKEHGF
jgi:nitroimidazol reductase NimA-like FMN-containing flavoprotein (pyridoxamine 5'-phosphate oxidase superfamily)